MNKKLLPALLFLGLGIGLVSNVVAKINDLVVEEPEFLNVKFIPEDEEFVNVPVEFSFEEMEIGEGYQGSELETVSEILGGIEAEFSLANAPVIEAAPEPVSEVNNASEVVSTPVASESEVLVEPEPVVYIEPNNIKITGRTLEIVDVDNTGVDSGDHVNRYGDRFLYGHNSSAVFGGLKNVRTGQSFSITLDGVVQRYIVSRVVIFEKNRATGRLELDGESKYGGKDYMNALARGRFQGEQYDLSIMTCYGTPYPGQDASHRLVLFANAV